MDPHLGSQGTIVPDLLQLLCLAVFQLPPELHSLLRLKLSETELVMLTPKVVAPSWEMASSFPKSPNQKHGSHHSRSEGHITSTSTSLATARHMALLPHTSNWSLNPIESTS